MNAALWGEKNPWPLMLDNWIQDLHDCGVDLEEYGRQEIYLREKEVVSWVWEQWWDETTWVMTDLTYGPSPSDWSIKMEELKDTVAEDPAKIPGGWIEEDYQGSEKSDSEEVEEDLCEVKEEDYEEERESN